MDITHTNWKSITNIANAAMKSSFCCGMGSVDENGTPNVTPIGSLVFTDVGKGFYFEEKPVALPKNIRQNSEVCLMAVNSSKRFWLKFFISGRFSQLPGIRLYGTAGKKRKATDIEQHLWKKKIKALKGFKGYTILWSDLSFGREIEFHSVEPVQCGPATDVAVSKLWL